MLSLHYSCTTPDKGSGYSGYILADIKRLHSLHRCERIRLQERLDCTSYTPGQRLKLQCFHLCRKTRATPLQDSTGYNTPTSRQRLQWFYFWGRKKAPLTLYSTPLQEDTGYNSFSIVGWHMLHWLHPCRKIEGNYTPRRHRIYQMHPCRKRHATLATPLQEERRQLHP